MKFFKHFISSEPLTWMILACCRLLRKISLAFSYGLLPEFHDIPRQFLYNQKFIRIYFIGKLLHGHGGWKINVIGCSEESLMDSIASSFDTKSFSGFLKPWRSTTKFIDFYFQKSRTPANDRVNLMIQMIVWRFNENRLLLSQLPHHSLEYSMIFFAPNSLKLSSRYFHGRPLLPTFKFSEIFFETFFWSTAAIDIQIRLNDRRIFFFFIEKNSARQPMATIDAWMIRYPPLTEHKQQEARDLQQGTTHLNSKNYFHKINSRHPPYPHPLQPKKLPEHSRTLFSHTRSEERRVGKECRSRWSPYH